MSTDKLLDESIAGWLEQTAPARLPDSVLGATFERTRKGRQQVGWRAALGRLHVTRSAYALAGAAAVVAVAVLTFGSLVDRPAVGGPSSNDHRSIFLGTWISTSDADGGTQTMIVRASGSDGVEVVVTDDIASVCSRTPSKMTGIGSVNGDMLVIPSPVYTCDDGREPQSLSGSPLAETLRNLTYVHDLDSDTLRVGPGSEWTREVATAPSPATTTPPSKAEVDALLNGFLDARIAGKGAQPYLDMPEEDVPLLYATTSGAAYERAEFEPVRGIEWPRGLLAFKVRLFAADTVVEQLFFQGDGLDLEYERDGFATEIAPTTENGRPVPVSYSYFDGEVTLRGAHPWVMREGDDGGNSGNGGSGGLIPEGSGVRPTTDGAQRHDGWDELMLMADPALLTADCQPGPVPADAEALAESIRSHPDLGATAPVAVTVGGAEAVMMDVAIPAGATVCLPATSGGDPLPAVLRPVFDVEAANTVGNGVTTAQATGERMRLYLIDAPEGSSMRTLVIAIYGPESSFDRAVEAAAPVIGSVEFHAP